MSKTVMLSLCLGAAACRIGFEDRSVHNTNNSDVDAAVPVEPIQCAGYTQLDPARASTYRVLTTPTDWVTAEQTCEADAGHLVDISCGSEAQLAIGAMGTTFWIGDSDRVTEGTFLEVDGGEPSYTSWFGGTAPANLTEDCVSLLTSAMWEDERCDEVLPALCECDGDPADPSSY